MTGEILELGDLQDLIQHVTPRGCVCRRADDSLFAVIGMTEAEVKMIEHYFFKKIGVVMGYGDEE